MSVAEAHATWAHRNGKVLVLWSHGRFTEHPREHAKPARTIGKHVDTDWAASWAKRHGFEQVGLVAPPPLPELDDGSADLAPAETAEQEPTMAAATHEQGASGVRRKIRTPEQIEAGTLEVLRRVREGSRVDAAVAAVAAEQDATSDAIETQLRRYCEAHDLALPRDATTAAGRLKGGPHGANPASDERALMVVRRIEAGSTSLAAIAAVAEELGLTKGAIHSAYYGWRKRQKGAPLVKRGKAHVPAAPGAAETAGPPAPEAPAPETPAAPETLVQAAEPRRNGHAPAALDVLQLTPIGVSPVAGEETDPLEAVRRLGQAHGAALRAHWSALRDARAALDDQVNRMLERMATLEEHEDALRSAAKVLGVELPALVEEAS